MISILFPWWFDEIFAGLLWLKFCCIFKCFGHRDYSRLTAKSGSIQMISILVLWRFDEFFVSFSDALNMYREMRLIAKSNSIQMISILVLWRFDEFFQKYCYFLGTSVSTCVRKVHIMYIHSTYIHSTYQGWSRGMGRLGPGPTTFWRK